MRILSTVPNTQNEQKCFGYKNKNIGWETLCTYATLEQNTSKHFRQLTLPSNFACYTACTLVRRCYLAERDTSLTPLYGDDTAVLCSFKFSST